MSVGGAGSDVNSRWYCVFLTLREPFLKKDGAVIWQHPRCSVAWEGNRSSYDRLILAQDLRLSQALPFSRPLLLTTLVFISQNMIEYNYSSSTQQRTAVLNIVEESKGSSICRQIITTLTP